MKLNAIKCKKCGDTIYSRTRHDMRWCSCKSIAIDGGFDYIKVAGEEEDIENKEINVNVSKKDLYDDWNKKKDKYGLIKETRKENNV